MQIALIGNQRAGALYRDARHDITAALEDRFDAIARSMSVSLWALRSSLQIGNSIDARRGILHRRD